MIAIAAIVGQVVTVSLDGRSGVVSFAASVLPVLLMVRAVGAGLRAIPGVAGRGRRPTRFVLPADTTAYTTPTADQAGWPGLPNGTAIYPAMYEAWKKVGPGKRIWSFHILSYCMLPGCHVREPAFIEHVEAPRRDPVRPAGERRADTSTRGIGLLLHFDPHSDSGCVAMYGPVLARHDPEPFGCRVDRWARCAAELEGARRRAFVSGHGSRDIATPSSPTGIWPTAVMKEGILPSLAGGWRTRLPMASVGALKYLCRSDR